MLYVVGLVVVLGVVCIAAYSNNKKKKADDPSKIYPLW
ncbi:hypothetical protein NNJEOMEG_00419 [Fundidesulfovibrio magnetotacticus]|uniref:Uncharacterized protein n=1 Tax=Fundidesulfovibrio magnetotacticus TaxID=2730080 RepID=A0A6V8LLL1_9BACT|nr:hypothetical protein NNJEOMEG_00419 [Fundidesulfovibrio magnetotacticus]